MTGTEEGERALAIGHALQLSTGLEVPWLSAEEVLGIAPFVSPAGLRAGTFCATDGIIDPHGVAMALCEEARRLGADLLCDTVATAIEHRGDRAHLQIAGGEMIEGTWVVNAAGPDARAVAAMGGVELPVTPYRRNLACTEPVPGYPDPIPMCVDADTGVLIRREAGGFLIGYSDPQDPPCSETTFDPRFVDAIGERVGNRFPFLAASRSTLASAGLGSTRRPPTTRRS